MNNNYSERKQICFENRTSNYGSTPAIQKQYIYPIIKKLVLFLVLGLLSTGSIAQTNLSGDVIITNPSKVSIALNYEFDAGTVGSFLFDGKELSLKIGKQVFNDVKASIGMGFRPAGEACFYVSLEDGVNMGAIDVQGMGKFYGNSLKVSFNPSVKYDFCVKWISNTSFMVVPEMATTQKMVIRPKVHVSSIPVLLFYNKAEIEPSIVLKDKDEETIEAYCLDVDKDIPSQGIRFFYSDNSIVDMSAFDNQELDSPLAIQSLVYSYIDGYSINENDVLYVLKGEKSSLLFFGPYIIVKYSNGELESSVPLPLEQMINTSQVEKMLQGKKNNRVYFNERLSPDIVQSMKLVLLMYGFQESDDGSLSCLDCDTDRLFEFYSEVYTPLLLNYYSTIVKMLEGETEE